MATDVTFRWGIRRDISSILTIESRCFSDPWPEDEFLRRLRERNTILTVAENKVGVIAYTVFTLHQSAIEVVNFAVHPGFWFQGVGRKMVHHLHRKITANHRRRTIFATVAEFNLGSHLFFKACGWRCNAIIRDAFLDSDLQWVAGYRFDWTPEVFAGGCGMGDGMGDEFACEGK